MSKKKKAKKTMIPPVALDPLACISKTQSKGDDRNMGRETDLLHHLTRICREEDDRISPAARPLLDHLHSMATHYQERADAMQDSAGQMACTLNVYDLVEAKGNVLQTALRQCHALAKSPVAYLLIRSRNGEIHVFWTTTHEEALSMRRAQMADEGYAAPDPTLPVYTGDNWGFDGEDAYIREPKLTVTWKIFPV